MQKSIDTIDTRNVVKRPVIKGPIISKRSFVLKSNSSTKAAIEIEGMPIMKENLAASSFFQPNNKAVDIVIPDLETPGIIDNACPHPIRKLLIKL